MKKALALALAAVLSVGMMVTSFAANEKLLVDKDVAMTEKSNGSLDDLEVRADGSILLSLDGAVVPQKDKSDKAYPINEANLKSSKIKVQRTISSGSNAIRDIDFYTDSNKVTYVRVRFIKEHISTKAIDFSIKVYLAQDGKRQSTYAELVGKLENEVELVESDRDYVDLSSNIVAEADGYNSKVEVYGGNGVSLVTKMMDGKKYYFTVNMEVSASDEKMLNKYSDLMVYNLNQSGFSTGGKMVKFDLSGDKFYAYNDKGEAIGTTADLLPFSSKIYLSEKKLDVATAVEEVEESEEAVESSVASSSAPEASVVNPNPNNNPNTGVNGLANVAVVAGVVALAAMGAVAFKK
ncbi:hypothetical protein U6B65_10190 [Oscillospiraceae bacterium MB08-C2-2]|nr:hypothetical protein U6B65_10190 [Oscillospiraceae bacterium MB08-C2-2]